MNTHNNNYKPSGNQTWLAGKKDHQNDSFFQLETSVQFVEFPSKHVGLPEGSLPFGDLPSGNFTLKGREREIYIYVYIYISTYVYIYTVNDGDAANFNGIIIIDGDMINNGIG